MSLTLWWVWLKKYQGLIWPAVALLLAFSAGWQLGKITSPYYSSHPIVFQSGQNSSPLPESVREKLQALHLQPTAVTTSNPAVAAAQDLTSKQFVGSVNSDLYHHSDCPSASRIKPGNQVWFSSRQEAEAAGYSPSQCTKEKLGL